MQPYSKPTINSKPDDPYPITFVQADTSSFKQVVQMLTGSPETARLSARPDAVGNEIPLIDTGPTRDVSSSKLYDRRNSRKSFRISPLSPGLVNSGSGFFPGYSGSPRPGKPEILSRSVLNFPALVLSPVTPLTPDPFNRGAAAKCCEINLDIEEEERAIKDEGFYLQPSPANSPRDSEPRLLPLFPVTMPGAAGSSNAADP